MNQNDYKELLDSVSPEYYRLFRRLYNELLGYIERDEVDKINAFSKDIHERISASIQVKESLQRRLDLFRRDNNLVQKKVLHRQFREPKETISITLPFPLKASVELPPEPKELDASNLETDRNVDQLLANMAEYDRKKVDVLHADTATQSPVVSSELSDPQLQNASDQRSGVVSDTAVTPDKGESLDDEFVDNRLKISKFKDRDVDRAEVSNEAPSSTDAADEPIPEPPAQLLDKKERIWDYIDNDQSTGDNNELR